MINFYKVLFGFYEQEILSVDLCISKNPGLTGPNLVTMEDKTMKRVNYLFLLLAVAALVVFFV